MRAVFWTCMVAATACGAGSAAAQSAIDRDVRQRDQRLERDVRTERTMRELFDRILSDPSNPELNFRYARLAIERGDYQKALAAYERVLARDSNNAEAKAGIARLLRDTRPSYTSLTFAFGAQYESNPRHDLKTGRRTDDAAFSGRISLTDERPIGDIYWKTEGDASGIYYPTFHDIDSGTAGARTGPLLELTQGLRINPFVGVYYSWLARRTYSTEPTAGIVVETDRLGPLKSVTARGGYQFVGRGYSDRDGVFAEVVANFEWRGVGFEKSLAGFSPYWRYSGVLGSGAPSETPFNQPFPARQHQIGGRADYFLQVLPWMIVNVNFSYEYRRYFEEIPLENKNRRDHVFAPGAQIIFGSFAEQRLDVVASYLFEYRHSNDGSQRYMNHVAGLRFLWRM